MIPSSAFLAWVLGIKLSPYQLYHLSSPLVLSGLRETRQKLEVSVTLISRSGMATTSSQSMDRQQSHVPTAADAGCVVVTCSSHQVLKEQTSRHMYLIGSIICFLSSNPHGNGAWSCQPATVNPVQSCTKKLMHVFQLCVFCWVCTDWYIGFQPWNTRH